MIKSSVRVEVEHAVPFRHFLERPAPPCAADRAVADEVNPQELDMVQQVDVAGNAELYVAGGKALEQRLDVVMQQVVADAPEFLRPALWLVAVAEEERADGNQRDVRDDADRAVAGGFVRGEVAVEPLALLGIEIAVVSLAAPRDVVQDDEMPRPGVEGVLAAR